MYNSDAKNFQYDWGRSDDRTDYTVPANDADVKERLRSLYSGLTADNLIGIFEVKRSQGMSLLDAYEYTLQAYLTAERQREVDDSRESIYAERGLVNGKL